MTLFSTADSTITPDTLQPKWKGKEVQTEQLGQDNIIDATLSTLETSTQVEPLV